MKTLQIQLIFVFLATSFAVFSQQTRKVLFLGNSYTQVNNLPQIVSDLASNTGDILIYDSNLIGGYTLQNHFASIISKNKILSDNWDYIVLQEQSQTPAFEVPSAFMNGFSNLKTFITQNKPCAQITSFMTWGYENGDTQNCAAFPPVCTYLGMHTLLRDRYMAMSDLYESEVTPVGVVWKYIRDNHPTINLYQADGSHPSLAGSYLAACCFYISLFRKNPNLITNNYGLDANTAAIIRNAAKTIVFDHLEDWYIGRYVPNSNFNYIIGSGTNQVVINQNTTLYQDSFIWDFGDGTTSTAQLPTHSYATDGTYTITLTSNNCFLNQNQQSIFERTVTFCSHTNTIFPNLILCPNVPGTIWTQAADSYQWCDDFGNPISGATNQSLEVFAGFSYSVLTTINGCTERSPQILVDMIVGGIGDDPCAMSTIDATEKFEVIIFPNPTQRILNIQTQQTIKEVSIYNFFGGKITSNGLSTNTIDVSNLAEGIYLIKVIGENGKLFSSKFIKK